MKKARRLLSLRAGTKAENVFPEDTDADEISLTDATPVVATGSDLPSQHLSSIDPSVAGNAQRFAEANKS